MSRYKRYLSAILMICMLSAMVGCNTMADNSEDGSDLTFTELCIVNGYAATEKKWRNNNRVKQLKLYYEGEYPGVIEFDGREAY